MLLDDLTLQALRQLRLHFIEARHLGIADVIKLDDVVAERALYRLRRVFAFCRATSASANG